MRTTPNLMLHTLHEVTLKGLSAGIPLIGMLSWIQKGSIKSQILLGTKTSFN